MVAKQPIWGAIGTIWVASAWIACSSTTFAKREKYPVAVSSSRQEEIQPLFLLPIACTPTGNETCFDGIDNNCNGLLEEGCGVHSGLIHVVAAWSEPNVDVDLKVIDPEGKDTQPLDSSTEGLQKDRDCPMSSYGSCEGKNMENIFLSSYKQTLPLRGTYTILLKLVKTGGAFLPISVRVGARFSHHLYTYVVNLAYQEEEKTIFVKF